MSSTPPAPYSLTIGTPCFGGQVSWLYAVSLLKLQKAFTQRGWHINYLVQAGDALVTRARQTIVSHFLDNPSATHLLFIDADIGFEPDQVLRLLEFGADVSAAVYPVKQINWDQMAAAVRDDRFEGVDARRLDQLVQAETARREQRERRDRAQRPHERSSFSRAAATVFLKSGGTMMKPMSGL